MLFAFPSRYWFTIGRQRVFSLGEWSPQLPTGFHVSRGTQDTASSPVHFPLRGSHTLWLRFPADSRNGRFGNSTHAVLQPHRASTMVWAVPISLAATLGISVIYFPPGTEMVHFPGLAHTRLCIQRAVKPVLPAQGFPIRTSPDQSLLAAPRGLSQLATSFIAFWRQGIHRTPLVA